MENKEELYTEILKRVQRNYKRAVEVERVTKELADALSRNDQESVQLLMKMRQEELEQIMETKQELQMLLDISGGEKEKLTSWLRGEEGEHKPEGFEAKKVLDLSCQFQQSLKRTIEVDKVFSMRVAGKDSYYKAAQ